ncbi:dUTPase [Bacillus methanolicus PB1]|uniref:dUTPase n=1 Tax=Bacillus methanolicus PB1 TaxID=997296 RepID=I3DY91_BACMT|nr:dUTP diphosphatase [Bacillus methanolicus]EIJ79212.1 dUTPase [Bacillus methanolicus PB1]
MDFQKLFEMQKALDRHIETKHQLLDENLFDRKVLALLVELGELANETRCFKFWSVKPPSPHKVVLEEFVDGIHFILSLGIEFGFELEKMEFPHSKTTTSLNEQFLRVYQLIVNFKQFRTYHHYQLMFRGYLELASLLGFTPAQIEQAYIEKNEVNYERQRQGY